MNPHTILILCLLCVSASCYIFKWNKIFKENAMKRIRHIAHQGDTNGDMHLFWESAENFNKRYSYLTAMKATYYSDFDLIGKISRHSEAEGLERASVQVSNNGKSIFIAYLGCTDDVPVLNRSLDACSHIFTIESNNSGKTWSFPEKLLTGGLRINLDIPIATIRDRELKDTFIFFATRTNEPDMSGIAVYYRGRDDFDFRQVAALPKMKKVASIGAGLTVNVSDSKRYLHLLVSGDGKIHHLRSFGHGSHWNFHRTYSQAVTTSLYNFVAISTRAQSGRLYVQYREKSSNRLYVSWLANHGDSAWTSSLVGEAPRLSMDAVAACESEEGRTSVVVSSYVDYHERHSYIRVHLNGAGGFQDLPYPFKNVTGVPVNNLMVGCAYRGTHRFYITFAILAEFNMDQIHIAHGTLDLNHRGELTTSEQ